MNNTKWSSTTRLVVVLTLLIGFIVLVIWAFPLVEALSITALLAYLLDPLVKLVMRKLRMKRFWAVIIVYVLLLVILVSIPATFGTIAYGQFERWSADLQSAVDEIEKFLSQPVIFFGLGFFSRKCHSAAKPICRQRPDECFRQYIFHRFKHHN